MSCGVGHRSRLEPKLLWLWHRQAAIAPIPPIPPMQLSYAKSMALKRKKKKRKDVKHGRSLKSVRRNFSLLDSLFGLKVSLLLSYYYVLDTVRCLPDYIS